MPRVSDPTGTRARGAGDALAIGDEAVASGVPPGAAAGRPYLCRGPVSSARACCCWFIDVGESSDHLDVRVR